MEESFLPGGNQQGSPGQESQQEHGAKKPERLFVLEDWSEVALKIMLEDKCVDEIGVAVGAEDVPGQGYDREGGDCRRMYQAECGAPLTSCQRPNSDGSSSEDNCCGAFSKCGESERCAEE